MAEIRLGEMEGKFAEIIWENDNIPSGELVKICAERLDWSKSTTYTMLRRLCGKGIFINENGVVRSLMSREEFSALKGEQLLDEEYGGSLPRFLAAFAGRKKLSEGEIDEIQQIINGYRRDLK